MGARLYLVRHGKPAGTFSETADAGLDPAGAAQAEDVAGRLAPLGPLALLTSPLRRTRETAAPLERRWGRAAPVEPRVAEIPSPSLGLAERGTWLRGVMAGRWSEQAPALRAWRDDVVRALAGCAEATVIFTHYVALNVAVGHATGDDRVTCFAPGHCSVTILEVDGATLRLIEKGAEAATQVL